MFLSVLSDHPLFDKLEFKLASWKLGELEFMVHMNTEYAGNDMAGLGGKIFGHIV